MTNPKSAAAINSDIGLITRFTELSPEAKDWITSQSKTLTHKAGDFIIRQGEAAQVLFAIISGSVKKFSVGIDGNEIILVVLGPGECFCEMTFLGQKTYEFNATALEETKLLCVGKETYLALLEKFPESVLPALRDLSFRITALQNRIVGLSAGDVEHRLAHLILASAAPKSNAEEIYISDLSRQDLASLIGTRPETLSRVISDWCSNGIAERMFKKTSFQKDELQAIVNDTGILPHQ